MRYITFKDSLIHALLLGQKTQTRRIMNPMPEYRHGVFFLPGQSTGYGAELLAMQAPLGRPGERFGVKENAWMWCERHPVGKTATGRQKWAYRPMREAPIHYRADHPDKPMTTVTSPDTGNVWEWRLKISRFLPAWAVRIHCELTEVRAQRLQDIDLGDCKAEGTPGTMPDGQPFTVFTSYRDRFRLLWDSIHPRAYGWHHNPVVFAYSFRRIQP